MPHTSHTPEAIDCCPICEQSLPYNPSVPEQGKRIVAKMKGLHGLNPAAYRKVVEACKEASVFLDIMKYVHDLPWVAQGKRPPEWTPAKQAAMERAQQRAQQALALAEQTPMERAT